MVIVVFLLVYIALIVTFIFFDVHLPKFKIIIDKPLPPSHTPALTDVKVDKKEPSHGEIITRPSAKKLRMLNDPQKQEAHDAFMGTLDNEPVLRASREATDPSKKGYVA